MTRADGREPTLDTRQAIAFLKAMIPAGPIHPDSPVRHF